MARNKHPEQTVKLILDTASTLFFQKGYDHTTLQDIIDATHLSKGAIYHHFASKEAILIAVADRMGEYNTAVLAGQERSYRGGEAAGDVPHRRTPVFPGRHREHAALPP